MRDDPIVEEVRRIREEYAREFNNDVYAMVADLREFEKKYSDRLVSRPPRSGQAGKGME
jgi:hypothetical protein